MPAEWHPHRRCWMAWPTNPPAYLRPPRGRPGRRGPMSPAPSPASSPSSCSPTTPIWPGHGRLCGPGGRGAAGCRSTMAGFRDNGPTFVLDGLRRTCSASIDWDFNGWGGRCPLRQRSIGGRRDNPRPGERSNGFPRRWCSKGGSIHVDGEGTVLTTEECLLNPQSQSAAQPMPPSKRNVKEFLGVETVIWLKGGRQGRRDRRPRRPARGVFVSPGVVIALSPARIESDVNYRGAAREPRDSARSARDAKGRSLRGRRDPAAARAVQRAHRQPASVLSHINYYAANGGIVLPAFGFPDHDDRRVLGIFRDVFSDREVVPVPTLEVAFAAAATFTASRSRSPPPPHYHPGSHHYRERIPWNSTRHRRLCADGLHLGSACQRRSGREIGPRGG
jgi:agmatine deiminase